MSKIEKRKIQFGRAIFVLRIITILTVLTVMMTIILDKPNQPITRTPIGIQRGGFIFHQTETATMMFIRSNPTGQI